MKILIWGTGQLASYVVKNISEEDIIGYIDSYSYSYSFANKPLYRPEKVKELEYDAILVATVFAQEIAQAGQQNEIDLKKMIYVYGNVQSMDLNINYDFVQKILGEKYSNIIKNRYHQIREIDIDIMEEKKDFQIADYSDEVLYKSDYIRVKTLELLVDEIKRGGIEGQVAELGVFRGDFAQFLNVAFPDRKLYLFDTFEGFSEEELQREDGGHEISAVRDTFKNTSVQVVTERMKYKETIVVKQGLFPDSLGGLDEKFAFVSLDCDFEESLYQGLKYFYPRLEKGGYIMMHDYNNRFRCAKRAIDRYESERQMRIPKVPICDAQGSLILTR